MPNKKVLATVHDNMIDGLSQLAQYFGFSKVLGQLFGTLMLNNGPLCLDDIVDRLNISKASVSMNMRTLEHMGIVRQAWVKGGSGRRKYYEAETDFWKIIGSILSNREMRDVDRALEIMNKDIQVLRDNQESMTPTEAQQAQIYIDRMESLIGLFELAQLMISSAIEQIGSEQVTHVSQIRID